VYDYDDGYDYEPEYEPEYADYEAYGLNVDSEEDSDDDRSSLGPDEWKPMIKQEEDKTTVRILNGARPAIAEEAQVTVKQEVKVKEEIRDGPAVPHPIVSKIEPEETPASKHVPGPNASGSGVTGSGAGKRASPGSGVGPDVRAGKMVSSHDRCKVRDPISHTTHCRSCEATDPNHTKSCHTISLLDLLTVSTTMYAPSNVHSPLSVRTEVA